MVLNQILDNTLVFNVMVDRIMFELWIRSRYQFCGFMYTEKIVDYKSKVITCFFCCRDT